ncbi:MAG: hypothetical protein ACREIM_09700 [Nitrospiraceae bacterium]
MLLRFSLLTIIVLMLWTPYPTLATTGDVGVIIETFVSRHFPDAASHFWVVNSTQWDGDEMILDVNAVVVQRQQPEPVANRFLMLIVAGKLEAVQSIPLNAEPECRTDEEA